MNNFVTDSATYVGEKVSELTLKVINFLANLGLSMSETSAKIISLLILSIASFLIVKIIQKPIKWLIFVLLMILFVSVVFSLTV